MSRNEVASRRRDRRHVVTLGLVCLAVTSSPSLLRAQDTTGQGASGVRQPVFRPLPLPKLPPSVEPVQMTSPYSTDDHTILLGRAITGGTPTALLWLAVGDSTELAIEEWECRTDLCGRYTASNMWARNWGRWSVIDPSIARVHPSVTRPGTAGRLLLIPRERVWTIVAQRPGRTRVRASGVHTLADSVASRIPVDSIVEREVLVTPPIGRMLISPRPTRMIAGDSTVFTVRVLDRSGRPIRGAPVELLWGTATWREARMATVPVNVSFREAGRFMIVAGLGEHADTLHVEVAAPPR